jgi:hypothetical protein
MAPRTSLSVTADPVEGGMGAESNRTDRDKATQVEDGSPLIKSQRVIMIYNSPDFKDGSYHC